MQWADASLLDFIEYLLEWARNSPIFVVTLARPELLERRPTWGAGKRNFTSIYLEPLVDRGDGGAALGARSRAARGSARRSSPARRASRSMRSRRCGCCSTAARSSRRGAVYRPTGTIESLEVPETLQALIAARLDGLPPEERRLVQDAAVLGKTFTKRGARIPSGLPEAELEPLLSSLARKEVLGVQADPRSPEHGQYGFLQDLLRKVAYETLAKADRKARHLAAAAFLEQGWSEQEVVEVVASHYLAAYEAAPDAADAPRSERRRGDRLARAGERAASLGANEEAERYFAQAAELAEDTL